MKLKGISICFSMLKAALCGSYVNFGVFRLYGDDALDNALNSFVKLLLSIPQSDLLVLFLAFFDHNSFSLILSIIHLGLSKTVPNLLRAIGMPSSRPHELSCHHGTPGFHVHFVVHLRRADSPRWEPQLLYRCLTSQKLFLFKLKDLFVFLNSNPLLTILAC